MAALPLLLLPTPARSLAPSKRAGLRLLTLLMELSPTHPACVKFRFCLPLDSPDAAVAKLNQFYDEGGVPPLTFIHDSPAAPRELSETPPGSPVGPVILPFSFSCSQPGNPAAKGGDVGDHITTTKFPTEQQNQMPTDTMDWPVRIGRCSRRTSDTKFSPTCY